MTSEVLIKLHSLKGDRLKSIYSTRHSDLQSVLRQSSTQTKQNSALHGAAHRRQSNSTNSFQLLRAYLERERQRKRKTPANPVPKTCAGASWTPPAPGSGLPASVALHGALLRKHEACGEAASVWELWKDKHTGVRVEFRLARSRWRTRPPLATHHPGFRRLDTSPEKEICELNGGNLAEINLEEKK